MKINEIGKKVLNGINKLPFNRLMEKAGNKVKVLSKIAPAANYIFCGLVVVVIISISSGGDSATKIMEKEFKKVHGNQKILTLSKPEDFSYVLNRGEITIKGYAKYDKSAVAKVYFPSEIQGFPVTQIDGEYTIWDVKIPSTCRTLVADFYLTHNIKKFEIPKTVEEISISNKIGGTYFENSLGLHNDEYLRLLNIRYDGKIRNVVDLVIPDSTTRIPNSLFSGISTKKVKLPSGLRYIGHRVFEGNEKNYGEVIIPDYNGEYGRNIIYYEYFMDYRETDNNSYHAINGRIINSNPITSVQTFYNFTKDFKKQAEINSKMNYNDNFANKK